MSRHSFDPYIAGGSFVHRADPRVKLVVVAAYMLVVLAVPVARPAYLGGAALLLVGVTVAAGLSLGALVARAAPVIGLVALAALGLLFEGSPARFVSVSAKASLCAWSALLLSTTTPFHSILAALRSLHVPGVLVSVAGLAQRLVFVIVGEALRMVTAYRCRVPRAVLPRRVGHVTRISVTLCVRAASRTERMEHALLARGFDGTLRGLPLPPVRRVDLLALTGALAVLLLLGLAART